MDFKFLKVYSPKRNFQELNDLPNRRSPNKASKEFDWIFNLIHQSSMTLDLQQRSIFQKDEFSGENNDNY